jgi:hypothetical protein
MKKTLSRLASLAAVLFWGFGVPLTARAALINPNDRPPDIPATTNIRTAVIRVINYLLSFVGLIAVAFLIYAGFLYLFSGVSEENTKKAKEIITNVVIGIIIILMAWVIVNTVIVQLTGAVGSGQTDFVG